MSPLLYNALLNERQSPSEGVWIDQLCINQDEDSEKQAAVNAMDIIYKCARAVVIMLDDIEITKTEQEALQFYIHEFEKITKEGFRDVFYNDDPPYLTTNDLMRNIYLKIVRARWFSRAWCMHETRLGKQHIFMIRCEQVLGSPPTNFPIYQPLYVTLALKAGLEQRRAWLIPVLTRAIDDNNGKELRIASFMQVFAETFNQEAGGNPKIVPLSARKYDANLDKLSIAMNTISIGLGVSQKARDLDNSFLPPTDDECCKRFTMVAIAARDPTALCTSGHELQTNCGERSWMRWPLLNDVLHYKLHWLNDWDLCPNMNQTSVWIGLSMGFFNRAGGLRWATETRIKICTDFLGICRSLNIMPKVLGGKSLQLLNEVWKDLIIKTLACVMDCWSDWRTSTNEEGLDLCKTPLVRDGLQKLLDSETNASRDAATSVPIWTIQESPKAQSLIDLVFNLICAGPAVKIELGQSVDFWQAACLANETGSKVLTFVRRIPGKEIVCATPFVLFPDLPNFYSGMFRAWTLVKGEREQQNGEWVPKYHLMGKSKIFGRVLRYDEEHAFATTVKNVRIYGPIDLPL